MPLAHICNHPNCGQLIPPNRQHCNTHQPPETPRDKTRTANRRKQSGRTTTTWQHTRKQVLNRDNHTCQLQLPGCTHHANTVHKTTRGYHDTNPDNYLSACPHCHGTTDGPRNQKRDS